MPISVMGWVGRGTKQAARELAAKRGITLSSLIRTLLEREIQVEETPGRWTEWTRLAQEGREFRVIETTDPYRVFVAGEEGPVGEAVSGILVGNGRIAQRMADALNAAEQQYVLRATALRLVRLIPGEEKRGAIGELCATIEKLGKEGHEGREPDCASD